MESKIIDLIKELEAFEEALPRALPDIATSVSMTGKAVAERTIKERGFGEDYSTHEVPTFFMHGRELNGKGLTYLNGLEKQAKGKSRPTTTWGKFRQAQGLQDGHVDLTYSGKMWAGMMPQAVQINLFEYVAPLGNNSTEGQKKMDWNFERYGDFIGKTLTGDNYTLLQSVAYDEVKRLITQHLTVKEE